ncbi:hypothetical protein WN943_021507 [Citrus x changshan-huyou]
MELKTLFLEFTSSIMLRMVAGKRYYGDPVEDEEEARRIIIPNRYSWRELSIGYKTSLHEWVSAELA